MKSLYLIREMKLQGAKFNVYNEIILDEDAKFVYKNGRLELVNDDGHIWTSNNYYKIFASPLGYDMDKVTHLPYFAKVIEDLPGSCKGLEPKVYERCQLTTQFPGGYLVFQDLESKQYLKIAMNSHYYEPTN